MGTKSGHKQRNSLRGKNRQADKTGPHLSNSFPTGARGFVVVVVVGVHLHPNKARAPGNGMLRVQIELID